LDILTGPDGQFQDTESTLKFSLNDGHYFPLSVLVRMVKLSLSLLYVLESEALMQHYHMVIPSDPAQMYRYRSIFASETQDGVSFEDLSR
jgi:hypothetical protein